ncbi:MULTISPECIES: leucyl/phenylalanyl-tRNA--protein transferase [Vibrio]|uniref:Leucyl/phenylalanyl-tRNA--protein transferase n=2 Tax=Vibrio TaxID=662 RepID=A0A7X4LP09_9VIBR|nr:MULTISPECIES: leucyl/phenylalanyl-tRNA--protein transferase [Vibrio]MBF9000778.1 leucyl/phenylalanyl-tRNA--protein transferase [Vibrio nitrifigilis]MZI95474.1 leucyl/phenylalanyl-tRNA--protein transferase [Vibrio eleionomae]
MTIYLTELAPDNFLFPSPFEALEEPNGLLAFGGDLNPQRILNAYRQGIFPWYGPGEPILWWSPSPRAVFYPKTFKPSKSVKKFQRKQKYDISLNMATEKVIEQCAALRPPEETWLNNDMRMAYKQLSRMGKCHSVEVWEDEELVGGLYGLSIGRLFCGESMFSIADNASKIALWYFCHHFTQHQGELIDCQVMNPHLASLGATELPRSQFMQTLLSLKEQNVSASCFERQWLSSPIDVS